MDAIEEAVRGGDADLQAEATGQLAALRGCPQTPAFHAEGDVAIHSQWVYDLTREHASQLDLGSAQLAALRLAGLLHDVGKPATTKADGPDTFTAYGHDLEGASVVSELFATHPALLRLPLGVQVSVHALVRAHMWTFAGDRIEAGAALRLSHLCDPRLLMALWDSDARGRICDDAAEVADRVAYAGLVLADLDAARPGSFGVLDQVAQRDCVSPRAWRESFRALVQGDLRDTGAAAAQLAASERHTTGGTLTYTIGLPGLGKSTWAREVWAPATGGVVLSAEGARRRDRRAAAAQVLQRIPQELAAGRDVCIDATHLLRETRDVLITYAGRYGADLHAVYFRAPQSLALQRQRTRPAGDAVAATAIEAMTRKLRWPSPDEYQTLTVAEADGGTWDYNAQSRWLPAAQARAAHPARTLTTAGR